MLLVTCDGRMVYRVPLSLQQDQGSQHDICTYACHPFTSSGCRNTTMCQGIALNTMALTSISLKTMSLPFYEGSEEKLVLFMNRPSRNLGA